MNDIQTLRENHATLLREARAIVDKESLTPDEEAKADELIRQADDVEAKIKSHSRREALATRESKPAVRQTGPAVSVRSGKEPSARAAFSGWVKGKWATREERESADHYGVEVGTESLNLRSLSVGTSGAGGYLVPTDLGQQLEDKLRYIFPVLSAVGSFRTPSAAPFDWPRVDDTSNAAAPVAEGSGIGVASDPSFDKVSFNKCIDYYSPIVKISNQLLRDSIIDVPSFLFSEAFPERFAAELETTIVSSADGNSAPQGLLYGLSAGVNLDSGNAITFAKLRAMMVSISLAYRNNPGVAWMFHDSTWNNYICSLTDDVGRPLIQTNLQEGVAPRLLGYPVFLCNSLTDLASPGDNQVIGVFGDLQRYKVRLVAEPSVTRLMELYAANGQQGFMMHQAWDARHVGHSGYLKTLNSYDSP